MKVGIFITKAISPKIGGGFSYTEKFIHAVDSFPFDPAVEVCFVGRVAAGEVPLKRPYVRLSHRTLFKMFRALEKLGLFRLLRIVFNLNLNFQNQNDIKRLRKHGIDVLLYPAQIYKEVSNFPFISCNWDVGHLSTYAFPEFTENGNFESRHNWYAHELQKALAIIVESESGKNELIKFANIHFDKIFVLPLFPGQVIEMKVPHSEQEKLLDRLGASDKNYFYYPAQFWPHKNHYNLIQAFKKLLSMNADKKLRLILSGSDQGNKEYIKSVIDKEGLQQHITMLGFISNEEVFTLYKNSIALVMPTFLGPTNMPLLEAMYLDVPIICSDFEGHREICQDGALYVNPASVDSIFEAMLQMMDARSNELLKNNIRKVSASSVFTIDHAMNKLNELFLRIKPIRKTFR